MYQLYAYGQKYRLGESKETGLDVMPKLGLLNPYSEKFTKELPTFIYDDMEDGLGLKLTAITFNLAEQNSYQEQINNIINMISDQY